MRRESATLVIAELYALADELGQSGEGLRRDCADVLRRAVAQIELQRRDAEAGERRGTEPFPSDLEEEPQSLRRALDGKWLAADARIDELLSTARDEIIAFATAAESDLARCERGLRHRVARAGFFRPDAPDDGKGGERGERTASTDATGEKENR